jgi:flagellin-like protein
MVDVFPVDDRLGDRGVSPVIGVILMVAITVILAAVIASFVLGFGDNINQTTQAGADIETSSSGAGEVTVTWISEGDADGLSVTVTDNNEVVGSGPWTLSNVGESVTIEDDDATGDGTFRVTVVANGPNGQTTVATREVSV